jgi:hypothetical protein
MGSCPVAFWGGKHTTSCIEFLKYTHARIRKLRTFEGRARMKRTTGTFGVRSTSKVGRYYFSPRVERDLP